jgi:hypothetical protein
MSLAFPLAVNSVESDNETKNGAYHPCGLNAIVWLQCTKIVAYKGIIVGSKVQTGSRIRYVKEL